MPTLKLLLRFLRRLLSNRSMIWAMALREMRGRYAGTLVGLVWSVLHPLMMILIYWVVFSLGFRIKPSGDTPFIIYFLCGLLPWAAFSETVTASTHAITGNPHLVKKAIFPTEVLPFVHLVASMVSHIIMLLILVTIMPFNRQPFSLYNLQFVYFLVGMAVFSVGLGWVVSAMNVFFRDVGQVLSVVLNMWFWLTPVVWAEDMLQRLPAALQIVPKLNPMYYVVHGYRASFIPSFYEGFWCRWKLGLYFWVVSMAMLVLGGLLFRRLKPDFPEVL
ncbi:MAG: ABC transporter permease [Phycisphaerae bacterium]|nr:ABC transporter permease [Phycisphaerae bacterium]